MTRLVKALLFAVALAGCDGPSSTPQPPPMSRDFPTSALSLNVEADSDGPYTQVFASVLHGAERVELSDGDRLLTGPTGGALVEMTGRPSLDVLAQLEGTTGDLDVVLARFDGSRATSVLHVPPGFSLELPAAPASSKSAVTLQWNLGQGDYQTGVRLDGDCVQPIVRVLSKDPGVFVVQAADLVPTGGGPPCEIRASVARSSQSADFAKELGSNSSAHASQIRVGFFELVP